MHFIPEAHLICFFPRAVEFLCRWEYLLYPWPEPWFWEDIVRMRGQRANTHVVHRNPKGHVMKEKGQELGSAGFDRWRGGGTLKGSSYNMGQGTDSCPLLGHWGNTARPALKLQGSLATIHYLPHVTGAPCENQSGEMGWPGPHSTTNPLACLAAFCTHSVTMLFPEQAEVQKWEGGDTYKK